MRNGLTFFLRLLGLAYSRVVAWRRSWYTNHPETQRVLGCPVISIGNLVVGGSGKTPLVAEIAKELISNGERPVILSRGYARKVVTEGVLVVSDSTKTIEPVEQSGDEPQMLARNLPGVPVLVSDNRYLAGCLAERHFGCTVHLLDDGFQHLALHRDVELLIVAADDLDEAMLPTGRLRESLKTASVADAVCVIGDDSTVAKVGRALGVPQTFRLKLQLKPARLLGTSLQPLQLSAGSRIVALAGIARPERFFSSLRELGYEVVQKKIFRDHHWYTPRDLTDVLACARDANAQAVLTTEKDAMRLMCLGLRETILPVAYVPMELLIEPIVEFRTWLLKRLKTARKTAVLA